MIFFVSVVRCFALIMVVFFFCNIFLCSVFGTDHSSLALHASCAVVNLISDLVLKLI